MSNAVHASPPRQARFAGHYAALELNARVATATPHELVAMLIDGLRGALGVAERAVASGQAAARIRSVTRALAILDALDSSLDYGRGGKVARALAALYAQVRALVVAGNAEARPELFAGAAAQVEALGGAWAAIG